jgi:hypothetical protein
MVGLEVDFPSEAGHSGAEGMIEQRVCRDRRFIEEEVF